MVLPETKWLPQIREWLEGAQFSLLTVWILAFCVLSFGNAGKRYNPRPFCFPYRLLHPNSQQITTTATLVYVILANQGVQLAPRDMRAHCGRAIP